MMGSEILHQPTRRSLAVIVLGTDKLRVQRYARESRKPKTTPSPFCLFILLIPLDNLKYASISMTCAHFLNRRIGMRAA
jgi:hypothetical protein